MYSKICLLINVILMELRGIISEQDLKAVDLMQFSAQKFESSCCRMRSREQTWWRSCIKTLHHKGLTTMCSSKEKFLLFNFPFIVWKWIRQRSKKLPTPPGVVKWLPSKNNPSGSINWIFAEKFACHEIYPASRKMTKISTRWEIFN